MHEIATLAFKDRVSGDEVLTIVRANETAVAVCLSLARNGDLEVFLTKSDVRMLINALSDAVDS